MRAFTAFLFFSGCVAFSCCATVARSQSALPAFSDPYGGINAYVGTDAAPSSVQRSKGTGLAAKSLARKDARRFARKRASRKGIAVNATQDSLAKELALPSTAAPQPVLSPDPHAAKSQSGGLGFAFKWSAEDDPHFNTETSTVPAIDEIKRNANETPAENGSTIEGGLNFKF